jgi:hypothetical protein
MKRFNTYDLCTAKTTELHVIKGSNCSTEHVVPAFLNEELAHALMNFVFGKCFLPREHFECRSKQAVRNYKHAFELQALGIVRVEGTEVKLYREWLPLVKKLKREGWYYWFGSLEEMERTEWQGRKLVEDRGAL